MRFVDVMLAIPLTLILILILVIAGRSFTTLFIALGAVSWLTMARIVRAQTLARVTAVGGHGGDVGLQRIQVDDEGGSIQLLARSWTADEIGVRAGCYTGGFGKGHRVYGSGQAV